MLCAICKKAEATIFMNTPTEEDPKHITPYCDKCAREHGVGIISSPDGNVNLRIKNVTNQVQSMINELSNDMGIPEMNISDDPNEKVPIGTFLGSLRKPFWWCLRYAGRK